MVSVYVTRFLSLCRVMRTFRPCQLLCLFRLFLLTAGTPSMGSSYTLNCSVPGRGISGLLRGWLFSFLHPVSSDWRLFQCPFCFRPPLQKNLVFRPEEVLSYFVQWCSWKEERPRVAGPNPSPYIVSPAVVPFLKSCKVSIRAFWVMGRVTFICAFCWGATALPSFRE